jgi:hypothetical protein
VVGQVTTGGDAEVRVRDAPVRGTFVLPPTELNADYRVRIFTSASATAVRNALASELSSRRTRRSKHATPGWRLPDAHAEL